jgi:sodium transport system ATP-binding protein
MIQVLRLTKVFHDGKSGPVRAVDDVSFSGRNGQVIGLLGLNGAGKTTTLRMLATVLKPTSGSAQVAGHDIAAAPHQVRRHIGFLSGDTRLYDRLSAREVLVYFGQLAGMDAEVARTKASLLLERFDLTGFAERRVGQLSTGLKQRVNLARALISDPPVLILDEPTAGLDVLGAREVGRMIIEARNEGRCVLLSTHLMHEAEKLCDEVSIIHRGRIRAQGPPPALSAGYADLEDAFAALVGPEEKKQEEDTGTPPPPPDREAEPGGSLDEAPTAAAPAR